MERVRIPADLNEEDVFFSMGPVKLSIRQLTIIGLTLVIWYVVAAKLVAGLIGINTIFAMIACSWILIVGLALCFAKIGHRPIDVWIGDKISFIMGARTFVMREDNHGGDLQANLSEDQDMNALLEHHSNHRRG
jgi:hypothetical protein